VNQLNRSVTDIFGCRLAFSPHRSLDSRLFMQGPQGKVRVPAFSEKFWCTILLCFFSFIASHGVLADEPVTLRIMSFNLWVGGVQAGQELSQSAAVMKLADVIGMQETHDAAGDNSIKIAKEVGWHHFAQGGRTAVISRYPITGFTPAKWGVFIEVSPTLTVCLFNVHFPAAPYQPYQLLNIPYGQAPFISTEAEAIDWAQRSRGGPLQRMLTELVEVRDTGLPVFVTGDFNEPSHLDWTQRAAEQGTHPLKVAYPTTSRVTEEGLIDTYRTRFPDEIAQPGFTWTPLTQANDTQDHHDRIDFVFADKRFCSVDNCQVVGEDQQSADVVIAPWPSDHRAVLATIKLEKPK